MPGKQYSHISEFDVKGITFGPVDFTGGRVKVDVFRDGSSSARANRFNRLNLCRDASEPMITKYALDTVRDDQQNPDRRGLTIYVSDTVTRATLEAIDEAIIHKAVECSKEWFGKAGKPLPQALSEAVIRDRYQPLIFLKDEADEYKVIKIKVKTSGEYPTTMHLNEDGRYRKYGAKAEHLNQGASVVPVVSMSYGVWFIPGGKFGMSMQAEEMMVTPGDNADDDLSHFASSKPINVIAPSVKQTTTDTDETTVKYETTVESLPIETGDDDGPM
jgi:hypothetical protein